jgi:DNA-binding response OmpR family regulator
MSLELSATVQSAKEPVIRNATNVRVLRWPSESRRRERCKNLRIPRILLLEDNATAPMCLDELEDWVRPPISREDLKARTATLHARAVTKAAPIVDADEVLRFAGRWLALSPVEARLMRALVDSYRKVVSREALISQGWPCQKGGRQPRRNALDLQILRLRRRLGPLRLAIRTVWGRGYLLEPDVGSPLNMPPSGAA